ncbi:MAG: Transcription-repair-coupling factor [Chloroflexi bacterium]|nr:Transcription-repair-coupling factor [Chloroflexota bacterium]
MLTFITKKIHAQPAYQKLLADIKAGQPPSRMGLLRSARLPVLAALRESLQCPILLLTGRTDRALALVDELALWAPEADTKLFPEPDPLFYERLPWGESTRRDRIRALASLASGMIPGAPQPEQMPVLVVPARAAITRTLPRRDFVRATRTLKVGQHLSLAELAREWVRHGYTPASIVVAPGEFARRGGILDVWPPGDRFPARIEFFGDEVEMLRRFDPNTQRTIEIFDRLLITPAREYLLPSLEDAPNGDGPDHLEYHIPLLHPSPATLLAYLPQDALVLVDDFDVLRVTINEIDAQAVSLRKGYLADCTLEQDHPRPYLPWEQFHDVLRARRPLALGPVSTSPDAALAEIFFPNQRFGGELKTFLAALQEDVRSSAEVIVVSRQASRLENIWKERVSATPSPKFLKGNLEDGWRMRVSLLGGDTFAIGEEDTSLGGDTFAIEEEDTFAIGDGETSTGDVCLFTDGEIFGWERVQPRRRPWGKVKPPEAGYTDFGEGEWVVHVDHGVGRFQGLVRRVLSGGEGEYLDVEYAEGDRLFVPVHQANRLARYVGPNSRDPRITRLGSSRWRRTKERVREEVQKIAADLLALYAKREVVEGHAFSSDTVWQRELEASFPYIETDDQLQVLEEVKGDMEDPSPMDRLICGDVGYGKTEIAVRAAFKAVMDGKQVALLAPTTVLVQQHYDTFLDRVLAFPVNVQMLSRFRTPRQQRDTLKGLAKGKADIVIGTHRLLSSDVFFHDLGLLIVDEEQRFGVAHKEKIKEMRANVDVLTLTATPIPRTLYMALTGVRDISRLETPPEERLPVVTHVGDYDTDLIRRAIWRELERGGQVFFVHNRVKTIHVIRKRLQRIVPEARIKVAHGQMSEKTLSRRMREFTLGEIDVLLSTSIIESGLDIPNANTLIVDRADMFGLAQLYQLRGRVGRGAQQAYAYFFKHPRKTPTPEGYLRLETIAEHTQLGAGYSIAMRDLEIRGAGDLLGARQSGHIAAVGFHLYTNLLAGAVQGMKDQAPHKARLAAEKITLKAHRPLVQVDLPLATGLPDGYIPDRSVRLALYRRMAEITELEEVRALKDEFGDRFGELPPLAGNLFLQLEIKVLAEEIGLESVATQDGQIVLRYPDGHPLPRSWEPPSHVRPGKKNLWVKFDAKTEKWPLRLINILKTLLYRG